MKRLIALTITTLVFLTACSSTTATPTTSSSVVVATTTVAPTTTVVPATTLEPTTTTPPITIAPAVTKSPSTTIRKTTPTTYPQLQLTGTQEEQLTQVVAATAKVAAVMGFGPWSIRLYQLKQSIASYGITIDADPGTGVYTITRDGLSACFIWTIYDKLEPRAC